MQEVDLKPWQSRNALLAAFGALLFMIVLIALVGVLRIRQIDRSVNGLAVEYSRKTELLNRITEASEQRERQVLEILRARESSQRAAAVDGYQVFDRVLSQALLGLNGVTSNASERTAAAGLLEAAAHSRQAFEGLIAAAMRGDAAGASESLLRDGLPAQTQLEQALGRLLNAKSVATLDAVTAASAAVHQSLMTVALLGVLVFAAGLLVAGLVIRLIARSEEALHREKELAQVTLHSIGDGVITLDARGEVDYMNPVAEAYTGWNLAEGRGQRLEAVYNVVYEQNGKPVEHRLEVDAEAGDVHGSAVKLLGRMGNACAIRESFAPIHSSAGALVGWVVVFHDMSQIEEMAQQLTWQASHDSLTGLVNRREFERRLEELLATARSDKKQHALMFMDLDNFKSVNDTCGHAAGDELLRQLTTVMQVRMRGSDTLARLGGDEFGILLEACPLDQAVRIANGMREAIRDFRFIWQERTFGVGVSIGLVAIDHIAVSASRLLAAADASCYEAKSRGRDRVQVYNPQDAEAGAESGELHLVAQISHAFEHGDFRLYRQKIVPLPVQESGAPHYEILLRMIDRGGKLMQPGAFMPTAERYNLLSSIERWVIGSLVEYLHQQLVSGALPRDKAVLSGAVYAVNLSGASINDNSFTDFLRQLLTRFNLPRGLLCFEVTETVAISNLTKAAKLMHDVKAMGCCFALDDFGIGMSSFAYLKYLPVDYIKIDGMFVRDIASDQMDYAIVEAINRIAHVLGLKTVAEYVESEAIRDRLRAIGVDYAQGYYIAKPEALIKIPDPAPAVLENDGA